MDWEEAITAIRERDGIDAYTRLCREDNPDVARRDAYRGLVVLLASGWTPPPATRPTAATTEPDPWRERIRECPDYQPGCCASPAPYCTRYAINPDRGRCIECLTADNRGTEP